MTPDRRHYELAITEPLGDEIRRVLGSQYRRIARELSRFGSDPEGAAHDARRRIKETRAMLRLVRRNLGDGYDAENARLRDLARTLAAIRDGDAMLQTLTKFRSEIARGAGRLSYVSARRSLRRYLRTESSARLSNDDVQAVAAALADAGAMFEAAPVRGDSFALIERPLMRSYRAARRSFGALAAGAHPERVHEWRKEVKTLWYHLQLLRNASPALTTSYREMSGQLAKALGEHHDLFVLGEFLRSRRIRHKDEILAVLNDRSAVAEARALALAAELFVEKPSAWVERMRSYWEQSTRVARADAQGVAGDETDRRLDGAIGVDSQDA